MTKPTAELIAWLEKQEKMFRELSWRFAEKPVGKRNEENADTCTAIKDRLAAQEAATIAYIKRLEELLRHAMQCVRYVSYGQGSDAEMAKDLRQDIERGMPHLFNNEEKPHA